MAPAKSVSAMGNTDPKEVAVGERIYRLLQHLGIPRAHVVANMPRDWTGFLADHPEMVATLTLVCPTSVDAKAVRALGPRLLVFNGESGAVANAVRRATAELPEATVVTLADYQPALWSDTAAERTDELADALEDFLLQGGEDVGASSMSAGAEGEVAGVSFRVRGSGPPVLFLPLALAASQWDPLLPALGRRFQTIVLGGAELGFPVVLEQRGRSGYLRVFKSLVDELDIQPGESILDVGCGTGVLDRWLAEHTRGANPIIAVDVSEYMLREASGLAGRAGLEGRITFTVGSAEAIPFPDDTFHVSMACTVLEEADVDKALAELRRVTKPRGRVGVIVRAEDIERLLNIPISAQLKAKARAQMGAGVSPEGCADSSLYRRFLEAGIEDVRIFPQLGTQGADSDANWSRMEGRVLAALSPDEAAEWKQGVTQALAEGTFFWASGFHCAVGTKP